MKIYKVMKFYSSGCREGHTHLKTFSSWDKAEAYFKDQGLIYNEKHGWLWSDYIEVEEIE